uniref:Uncharacterized protein n=1 Tax=Trichogramma kaykai TaxID=54128 RepID=A0ABD2XGQ8_9HYME
MHHSVQGRILKDRGTPPTSFCLGLRQVRACYRHHTPVPPPTTTTTTMMQQDRLLYNMPHIKGSSRSRSLATGTLYTYASF